MFSSKSFIMSGITFRSLIHFEFIFVYGVTECSNFILLYVAVQFSQHCLLKRLSFLHCIFLFVIDQVTIGVCIYLWAFYPVPLIYISVFVPVLYCLDYYSLVVQSEVREPDSSNSIFLKIDLVIWSLLCLCTNRKIFCSNYVKNAYGNLIGIALNLYLALGSIVIFTILILPVQGHGISLHLFVLSLISFISILQFPEYRSFASLGRFIARYFILFIEMVNDFCALPLHIYIDYLDYLINRLLRSVLYFQIFGKFSRILFLTDLVFNSVMDFFNTQSIQKSVVQFSGVWRFFCYLSSLDFYFNDIMDRDNIA